MPENRPRSCFRSPFFKSGFSQESEMRQSPPPGGFGPCLRLFSDVEAPESTGGDGLSASLSIPQLPAAKRHGPRSLGLRKSHQGGSESLHFSETRWLLLAISRERGLENRFQTEMSRVALPTCPFLITLRRPM